MVSAFHTQKEIIIRLSAFLNGGKYDALVCGQSVPPGWPTLCSGGPLCVHHAYLECMTPASLAFCRNIMYFD